MSDLGFCLFFSLPMYRPKALIYIRLVGYIKIRFFRLFGLLVVTSKPYQYTPICTTSTMTA